MAQDTLNTGAGASSPSSRDPLQESSPLERGSQPSEPSFMADDSEPAPPQNLTTAAKDQDEDDKGAGASASPSHDQGLAPSQAEVAVDSDDSFFVPEDGLAVHPQDVNANVRNQNDSHQGAGATDGSLRDPTQALQLENGTLPSEPNLTAGDNEVERLLNLNTTVRNQDDLEADISRQADAALLAQTTEREQKRLDRAERDKARLVSQIRKLQQRLENSGTSSGPARDRLRREITHLQPQLDDLNRDIESIQKRMQEQVEDAEIEDTQDKGDGRRSGESRRDWLIRTGKITPFSNYGGGLEKTSSSLEDVMHDAEGFDAGDQEDDDIDEGFGKRSHQNLLRPGFRDADIDHATGSDSSHESTVQNIDDRPKKRRRLQRKAKPEDDANDDASAGADSGDEFIPEGGDKAVFKETETDEEEMTTTTQTADYESSARKKVKSKRKRTAKANPEDVEDSVDMTGLDDGNESIFKARVRKWNKERRAARLRAQRKQRDETQASPEAEAVEDASVDLKDEPYMPHPTRPDTVLPGDLSIPGDIFPSLFDYQKTGVRWLWELYQQRCGGIIGDEMGLGKTIQAIAFIAALHHSKKLDKPVLVVCPATVMKQWVSEFHTWWPALRVSILHTSGSGMMDVRREAEEEDDLMSSIYRPQRAKAPSKAARKVVDRVLEHGHVLVTTYSGLQTYADLLIPVRWGYTILDEGHKIRNPNAAITIYCKELKTHNRVILSGTPMQNNLGELWSLFDFVFPMRLGTLVNFRTQFEIPIKQGGYANASNLQVETALRCAEAVKEAISPYLLQRFKVDVAADLPKKTEQVLFCKLTRLQRDAYQAFLDSREMQGILEGKRQPLYGIDILRKICNHPDLQSHKHLSTNSDYAYGDPAKSGKMQIVKSLIELWSQTGHKTLLFAQHQISLDILQRLVSRMSGVNWRRMDGNTPIKDRQDMVDEFNKNEDLHVFLLTTKVGGLGVNLTGADRVIIFDPDWNPSVDVQARERAWRLGQKREVKIYRLMTAGTIEEKIYHRQIFKQFLTNKVLRNPEQRQTFQMKNLHDLFRLGNEDDESTETKGLFKDADVQETDAKDSEAEAALNDQISHAENFTDKNGDEAGLSKRPSNEDGPLNGSNDRLLSNMLTGAGVHSAMSHDAIMNSHDPARGKKKIQLDPEAVTREARRVAAQAAKHLQAATTPAEEVGVPTWTGEYGSAGRSPPPPARGSGLSRARGSTRGGSSSALLSRGTAASSSSSVLRPGARDFGRMIREYLLAQPGCMAYTQMLINQFNRHCSTEKETATFKEMLRKLAVLEKSEAAVPAVRGRGRGLGRGAAVGRGVRRGEGAEGRGKWTLKKEFGGVA